MRKLIIIPAYNESESIISTVSNIQDKCPGYDYVIINDGSVDDTLKICKKNHFNTIPLPLNLGIGGAVQTGYMYALDNDYDIAIQIDADGQHDPVFLDQLVAPIEEGKASMTIGSRFITNEGFQSSAARRMGIKLLSFVIHFKTGQKIYDVTSGFRAVDKSTMKMFMNYYPVDYPEPVTVATTLLANKKVIELPVIMQERNAGTSSIKPIHSIFYMLKVSATILLWRRAR